jgi:multicomponent Na+:H+ antiporter subunit B
MGIYVGLNGHLTPGGGFPAGAIMATGFALLLMCFPDYLIKQKLLKHKIVGIGIISIAMLMILMFNLIPVFRQNILYTQTSFEFWSGGFTLFFNILGGFTIFLAISFIVYLFVR